jgi:hypothetical protein
MLAPLPASRCSIADLIAHPWCQGEHATQKEVVEEFRQRHEVIKQQQAQEAQQKAASVRPQQQRVRRDLKFGDKVFVDVTYA